MQTLSASAQRKIALFVAILLSGGSLVLPRIPLLVLLVLLCLNIGRWKLMLDRALLPVLALLGAILAVRFIFPSTLSPFDLLTRYVNFAGALFLINIYLDKGHDLLATDLRPMLKFMAVQAIVTVIVANIVPQIFIPIPAGNGEQYTFLLLLNFHSLGREVFFRRPDGFFWEPGVLQIYLNLYLYLALYVFKNRKEALLALAAVFSTLSTTGLIVALVILAGSFLRAFRNASMRQKLTVLVGAIIVAIPAGLFTYGNINDKLSGEHRGSFLARQFDLVTGLNVIAAHPLVGIGFSADQYQQAARDLGFGATLDDPNASFIRGASTNGIIYLLYSVGIPFGLPFLIGLFRQRFFPHSFLIGIALVLSLMSESVIFTPFPLLLIMDGIAASFRKSGVMVAKESCS